MAATTTSTSPSSLSDRRASGRGAADPDLDPARVVATEAFEFAAGAWLRELELGRELLPRCAAAPRPDVDEWLSVRSRDLELACGPVAVLEAVSVPVRERDRERERERERASESDAEFEFESWSSPYACEPRPRPCG